MTKIEWASLGLPKGVTWNPIRARNAKTGKRGWHCEHVSEACRNCYAERLNTKAGDTGGTGLPYKPGHRQNGDTELYLDEKTLLAPLHWKSPRGIFVCSMTDIFGDWVSDEWLDRIYAIEALCPQHRFAHLTKRPERAREYCSAPSRRPDIWRAADIIACELNLPEAHPAVGYLRGGASAAHWPPPNVFLGVTAEDQPRADERRDDLKALADQGWKTFISYEPALGPVDWTGWEFVSQIIVGGESGPEQRIMPLEWADTTLTFCNRNRIAFFAKQLHIGGKLVKDMDRFPEDLRVREFPDA